MTDDETLYRRLARIPEVAALVEILLDSAVAYHRGDLTVHERLASEFDRQVPGVFRQLEQRVARGEDEAAEALQFFRGLYPKATN